MRFTKMHGAGNDYVYVDARGMDEDWPALAVAMSDRHTGIGSDGLILAGESDHADARMTMFNADGSEGQMCGNGVRCLVSFAVEQGIVRRDRSPVVVETASGDKAVTPVWENGTMVGARVDMGEPNVAAEDVPVDAPGYAMLMDYPLEIDGETIPISCVSMGNPHAVAFIKTPVADYPLHEIGPKVEHHPLFPERVNFEIVNVIDQGHVRARVWERGSGLTEECGTGACAVVAIGRLQRKTRGDVTVSLPGGDLHIDWPGEGGVMMEGPIAKVFEGDWRSPTASDKESMMTTTPTSRPIESRDIHSERLIEHAESQLAAGDRLQASEKAWGAVAHQLKVIADQRDWEYNKHQHVYGVVRRLTQELGDPDLMKNFIVADGLHKNYYIDLKPVDQLSVELGLVKDLLRKLKDVATSA